MKHSTCCEQQTQRKFEYPVEIKSMTFHTLADRLDALTTELLGYLHCDTCPVYCWDQHFEKHTVQW